MDTNSDFEHAAVLIFEQANNNNKTQRTNSCAVILSTRKDSVLIFTEY